MKTTKKMVSVFLLGAGVSGCAHHPPKLPPANTTGYDGVKAQYRDLTRLPDPCDVDGAQVAGELESVNALMSHFLEVTDPKREAPWTADELAQARKAKELLTPAVDAADNDIQVLSSRCPYLNPALRLQDAQKRGRDLIFPTRQRLNEIAGRVEAQQYKADLAKWKAEQVEAVKQAHENWCPPKPNPRKMPDIYYAAQDENGRTTWLFCDGAKVVTSVGGAPELVPPPGRRHHSERSYLSAANSFLPDEIKRPPTRAH
jgi:hypothetical protein